MLLSLKPRSHTIHTAPGTPGLLRGNGRDLQRLLPRGSTYQIFEVSRSKRNILFMGFGTRVLKYWVLGPFGLRFYIVVALFSLFVCARAVCFNNSPFNKACSLTL